MKIQADINNGIYEVEEFDNPKMVIDYTNEDNDFTANILIDNLRDLTIDDDFEIAIVSGGVIHKKLKDWFGISELPSLS